jgi:ParB-like nuclease domain
MSDDGLSIPAALDRTGGKPLNMEELKKHNAKQVKAAQTLASPSEALAAANASAVPANPAAEAQEKRKREKAHVRIEKLKASKSGATKAMPLEGDDALREIAKQPAPLDRTGGKGMSKKEQLRKMRFLAAAERAAKAEARARRKVLDREGREQPAQGAKGSWRDWLPVHPAAALFSQIAPHTSEDLLATCEDIREHGLRYPVIVIENDDGALQLLDGTGRLDAMELAGFHIRLQPVTRERGKGQVKEIVAEGPDETGLIRGPDLCKHISCDDREAWALVASANILRRHLTREQKHDLIVRFADWTKSDRAVAADFKTNKNTAGRLRKRAEATVPTGTVSGGKRAGRDHKTRRQPAPRPKPTTPKTKAAVVPPPQERTVAEGTVAEAAAPNEALAHGGDQLLRDERLRAAERKAFNVLESENDKLRAQVEELKAGGRGEVAAEERPARQKLAWEDEGEGVSWRSTALIGEGCEYSCSPIVAATKNPVLGYSSTLRLSSGGKKPEPISAHIKVGEPFGFKTVAKAKQAAQQHYDALRRLFAAPPAGGGRGMSARHRLPNRRASQTFDIEVGGLRYTCTVGRFADGKIGELFLSNHKANSNADVSARDPAIVFSIAIQCGADLETIRGALCRDSQGRASGPLAAVLDAIVEQEQPQ